MYDDNQFDRLRAELHIIEEEKEEKEEELSQKQINEELAEQYKEAIEDRTCRKLQ